MPCLRWCGLRHGVEHRSLPARQHLSKGPSYWITPSVVVRRHEDVCCHLVGVRQSQSQCRLSSACKVAVVPLCQASGLEKAVSGIAMHCASLVRLQTLGLLLCVQVVLPVVMVLPRAFDHLPQETDGAKLDAIQVRVERTAENTTSYSLIKDGEVGFGV